MAELGAIPPLERDAVEDCRIEMVEPIVLAIPGEPDLEGWQRGWTRSVLVRVQARCGVEGFGIAESQPDVVRAIIEAQPQTPFSDEAAISLGGLSALVTGESAANLAPLWQRMYRGTTLFGRRGAALQAISAVDIACTDLLARYLGISVSHMLGGRFRETVRAYASAVFPETADELHSLARYVSSAGFCAVKLGWGAFRQDTTDVIALVDDIRGELAPSVQLIFDIGYERQRTAKEVLQLIRLLEAYSPLWIEEPCHPDDLASYRVVAREATVSIAAGEACATVHDFMPLIEAGVEVIQPDLSRCGGFSIAQKVASHANAANCLVVPHAWQNDLLLAATLHLCSTLPREALVECSLATGALREICTPRTILEDGLIAVPSGPGLGAVPDPALVERFRVG